MVNWVSHLTFYLQHRIFWQPGYIRGIRIATCSACAFQKTNFVSETRWEPKQHKALLTEATVLMPSVLDVPTGLSCLPLHLNCPEAVHILSSGYRILF